MTSPTRWIDGCADLAVLLHEKVLPELQESSDRLDELCASSGERTAAGVAAASALIRHVSSELLDAIEVIEPGSGSTDVQSMLRSSMAHALAASDIAWAIEGDASDRTPASVRRALVHLVERILEALVDRSTPTRLDVVLSAKDGGTSVVVTDNGIGVDHPTGSRAPADCPWSSALEAVAVAASSRGGTLRRRRPSSHGDVVELWLPDRIGG